MNGEVRVVDDVASSYAALVATELASWSAAQRSAGAAFRLACSGGASGSSCAAALAARPDVDFTLLACYFVDERCVDPDAPESNARAIRDALGGRRLELAAFHPMSCDDGPEAYERILREGGDLDLVQLGFGPDGHTASLFPGSAAIDAPADRLVVRNADPTGRNGLERLTMTYSAIASARVAVVTVVGREKRDALAAVAAGEDLPASRVRADRVVWLCDRDAADGVLA